MNSKYTIVIPAYNEENSILSIISSLKAIYTNIPILIINDGSTDKTKEISEQLGVEVISHPYNIGNGASIKTAIRNVKTEYFVIIDADGQHDPRDIQELINELPLYDLVVGARTEFSDSKFFRNLGNKFLQKYASYLCNREIPDLTSGFRAIKTEIAREFIHLYPNRYSFPTTITLSAIFAGYSIKFVPITASSRKQGKSGIRPFKDGLRFMRIAIRITMLFNPSKVFIPISLTIFSVGIISLFIDIITIFHITPLTMIAILMSIIIFLNGLIADQISQVRLSLHP